MVEGVLPALGVLILFLVLGVPLPFCFGGALAAFYVFGDVVMKGNMLWGVQQLSTPMLMAVPLFLLIGATLNGGGVAASLLRFIHALVGHLRGGLGAVAAVSCAILGAISGSGLTGVAAIGPLLIPEMTRNGYPPGYSAALVANASVLGLLIPPSGTMIVYAWVTQTSVLACFLATLLPGLLVMALLCLVNAWMARKFPLVLVTQPTGRVFLSRIARPGMQALPALVTPVIILGGIYGGMMTPTEAAAVAVVYTAFLGLVIYRGLGLRGLIRSGAEAATATGAIMLMILFSLILSQMFTMERVPQQLVSAVLDVTSDRTLLLLAVNVLLFLVGMVVNDMTAIILLAPLLQPLMAAIGIDPVQFAAIMGVTTAMGGITPPYAPILFLGGRVGKVEVARIIRPAMVLMVLGYLPVVLLTSFWSDLSLFLPKLFGY